VNPSSGYLEFLGLVPACMQSRYLVGLDKYSSTEKVVVLDRVFHKMMIRYGL
jgi:hypothetical protein